MTSLPDCGWWVEGRRGESGVTSTSTLGVVRDPITRESKER